MSFSEWRSLCTFILLHDRCESRLYIMICIAYYIKWMQNVKVPGINSVRLTRISSTKKLISNPLIETSLKRHWMALKVIGSRFEKVRNNHRFENRTCIWGLDIDLSLTYRPDFRLLFLFWILPLRFLFYSIFNTSDCWFPLFCCPRKIRSVHIYYV